MYALLIAIIYLAFVSLGLPDSLLGAAWPSMQTQMGVPLSFAGLVSMSIAAGTVVSGLSADWVTKKFGTGTVTAVSVLLTALAMFGFSVSDSFAALCLWAIPYGLGAGAIDAALNNYVAVHYSSRHMNWLHCCWGVGVSVSPAIMGYCLTIGAGWHGGYRIISIMQLILTVILFAALPLWRRQNHPEQREGGEIISPIPMLLKVLRIGGVRYILIAFFGYCALEATTGLWASSFLFLQRGVEPETAAKYASLFYLGITAGRFLSGFISDKIGDKNMLRLGAVIAVAGIAAIAVPIGGNALCLGGLIVIGFGCAPVYPAILHATPTIFGAKNSQMIISVEMASAYIGSTFMPPLFGLIANNISVGLYPAFLLAFAALMIFMTEKVNVICGVGFNRL